MSSRNILMQNKCRVVSMGLSASLNLMFFNIKQNLFERIEMKRYSLCLGLYKPFKKIQGGKRKIFVFVFGLFYACYLIFIQNNLFRLTIENSPSVIWSSSVIDSRSCFILSLYDRSSGWEIEQ